MGSGMGSTSPPTNSLDKSSDLSGLEEWHIGLISFGILFVLLCCIFTVMVSLSRYQHIIIMNLLLYVIRLIRFCILCIKEG